MLGRAGAAALLIIAAPTVAASMPADGSRSVPSLRWTRYGTGLVNDIAIGDVDGDGSNEAIIGGRGIGVVGAESLADGRFRWANKWLGADGNPLASDAETAEVIRLVDVNDDGAMDPIAGSDRALFVMDGASGQTLWTATDDSPNDTSRGAWEVATGDLNGDAVPDVAFAELLDDRVSAVDGRDGSALWHYPRPGYLFDLAAADLNGDGFDDTVAVGETEFGVEVHAISGLAAADTGIALPLWVQKFPAVTAPSKIADRGRPGGVDIAQVLPGGVPEVVVAGVGAVAVFDGLTGLPRGQWEPQDEAAVSDVALAQLDGDADLEGVAATLRLADDGPPAGAVEAFDLAGSALWRLDTPAPVRALGMVDVDGDGAPEIVGGGGSLKFGGLQDNDGFAIAIDPPTGAYSAPVTLWTRWFPEHVPTLAVGEVFGRPSILLGHAASMGDGGGVHALDLNGDTRWFFRTGGRIEDVAATDIDGDGVPEILEAADDSTVAVHHASGALRWQARVPGKGSPDVLSVAGGDFSSHEGREVVAGTSEYSSDGPDGRVHAYSSAGSPLWSRDIAGTVDEVAVTDIEGDGKQDVLAAASAKAITEHIGVATRYDGSGRIVWSRPVPTGQRASLAIGDLDGDGIQDLLVGKNSVFHGGSVVALGGANGTELWRFEIPDSINWVGVQDGAVAAGDSAGRVRRLDAATGEPVWTVRPGIASWGGGWSIDSDGDGVRDVLSASHDRAARLLSGADGSQLWKASTDDNPAFMAMTVEDGPRPYTLVGALGNGTYGPAALFVLDAVTGQRLQALPTHSAVLGLTPTDLDGDGADDVVAGAGWQLMAIDLP